MKTPVVNLELIRDLRNEQEVSIEEMSLLLGYEGYQGYYYKERGIRKMSAEDIAGIAKVLQVPINSLFFEEKVAEMVTL
ncbi:XRE family transcriptional regulator [Viridibacillus sp. NPDC096237]|uniref:XRE family transcriptional regulator n=1 Tax=Viridibacillus sp. NPDC096237 TaxID=3390721 RepID=UPI003CFE2BC8